MEVHLRSKVWWGYLEHDLQELLSESELLIHLIERWEDKFHDYSFVVFPAAKAYEGFLKKMFFDLGFISDEDYNGTRFRIGKALNPSLERKYRSESVYDKLLEYCNGRKLPDDLWETWKKGRNRIFHWFPNEARAITFAEAKARVNLIVRTIDEAFVGCKIKSDGGKK